jgi:hypothetical protein
MASNPNGDIAAPTAAMAAEGPKIASQQHIHVSLEEALVMLRRDMAMERLASNGKGSGVVVTFCTDTFMLLMNPVSRSGSPKSSKPRAMIFFLRRRSLWPRCFTKPRRFGLLTREANTTHDLFLLC